MSAVDTTSPAGVLEISPYAATRATITGKPLSVDELRNLDIYWRACNYLSLG